MEIGADPLPPELLAVTLPVKLPAAVGITVNVPLTVLKVIPAGNAPVVIVRV